MLETTADSILSEENTVCYKGRKQLSDIIDGVNCLRIMGEKLGKDNILYLHAVNGINEGMNTDISEAFGNDRIFEAFVAEAVISVLRSGYYVDLTDISRSFRYSRFREKVLEEAKKYGIK